jgi:hypothetical protein
MPVFFSIICRHQTFDIFQNIVEFAVFIFKRWLNGEGYVPWSDVYFLEKQKSETWLFFSFARSADPLATSARDQLNSVNYFVPDANYP